MSLRRLSTRAKLIRRVSSAPELPFQPLELTIGVRKPLDMEDGPSHWILILAERNAVYGTWFDPIGGPRLSKHWEVLIEQGQLNSLTVDHLYYVAEVPARHKRKVMASARKVAGKFCQAWIVDVIGDLEEQGVVPPGTQRRIIDKVEGDPYADVAPKTGRQNFMLGCFTG
ncbi:hypothetical protein F53441_10195 [Fusarium austroafricanum]|uniref:Uncharacterized protein n=1 Tax=Fusarium austroafricanum TaxID=2364996 RepID=A0A8H4P2J7_9HYPO|nr:hypothetical protein F53441_10195 [Fusarium austroafricanum]